MLGCNPVSRLLQELFDLANKYGDVTSCKIVKDDRSA